MRSPSILEIKKRIQKRAAEALERYTLTQRRKIAWVVKNFPEESFRIAKENLENSSFHTEWEAVLKMSSKEIAEFLLNTSEKYQQMLSSHPFGSIIKIYEKNHPRRHHPGS